MSKLDQLVKGAPPPGIHVPPIPTSGITSSESSIIDPLASLPSSPPQIYLNLLILEASLRAQWLQLRTRRRQHAFFLSLLGLWNIWFGYALFLAPREDGSGVGGSVYWVVEMTEKMCFIGGIVTALLIWGTGQWERGIRWPRRFVGITNRGLRGFNCKLVVIKQPWWKELLSAVSFLFSYGLFSGNSGSSYRFVDQSLLKESEKAAKSGGHHALPNIHEGDDTKGYEEDLAPGGDYVKLLLLPKPFSPNFRENWDIYRTEYWEKENERRKILRQKLKERERILAKQQGGWLWWTGYRGWRTANVTDVEKIHHRTHRQNTVSKRDRSTSVRSHSHSRNSSRSATPTGSDERPGSGHTRKGSSASTISERRRKKALPGPTRLAPTSGVGAGGSRSTTPEVPSPLIRENSFTSLSSLDSERPLTPLLGDADSSTTRSLRSSTREKSDSLKPPKRTDGSAAESDEK
ncbi:hypothetical protein SS1G_09717 [Sclerotinia sclerotiorum 1980 UF-70]|uniref:Spo7-like protein n=2 Tax=Sclerotinia sclerotiorum (strain ATCC 18683 / 1980 / Ss-1) TaxID=665079 RepID=A0A1D9PRM3_SCLS1|nr:hypothetical protein SS1G_09717 [Sclerotinia sclerotiorum 1980 UF-70]APA05316.1 hypothetical protein sscle_01g000860 [Sclerotinia sclerotiorum 1980 UF-70]EDN93850.1 hypothetical protein SS1G_09717 [Sclerotinia sclerotiorum 1980 UF-70]